MKSGPEIRPARGATESAACGPSTPTAWRYSVRGTAVRLFITCWVIYAMHFATNIVREIYPAISLGDSLSLNVAEYYGLHPDIFELTNGNAYINNNPGASFIGAIPYSIFRPLIDYVVRHVNENRASNGVQPPSYDSPWPMAREFHRAAFARGADIKLGLAAGVMQTFAMAPISALAVVVMFYLLMRRLGSIRSALWLALLYGFATPIFFRTAHLNQNLLVAHCALFAFALLWRPSGANAAPGKPCFFAAGLLAGWAVVCDYSAVVIVAGLAAYAWRRRSATRPTMRAAAGPARFVVGLAVSGAALMYAQYAAFGNPILPAQYYMPPAHFTELGYLGFDWPRLDLLWGTAFDLRFGLFTSAPLLLFAFGVPIWWKSPRWLERRELCLCVGVIVLSFVFCSANQYGRMQFNSGVRHIVPVTPFIFLLIVPVLMRLPAAAACIAGVLGTYWSWCLAQYRDVEGGLGVLEALMHVTLGGFRLPWMTTLERMRIGTYFEHGASAIPLLLVAAAFLCALWFPRGGHPQRGHSSSEPVGADANL